MLSNLSFENILQISQIVAILGSWIWMFLSMKSDLRIVRHDIRHLEQRQDSLNEAFTQLGQILTQVAVQDNRINMIEKNVDELRHGQGFIGKQG